MTPAEQTAFALLCGTTIGYIRRCLSIRRALSMEVSSAIELHSGGAVRLEDLRPDIPVRHLRSKPVARRRAA